MSAQYFIADSELKLNRLDDAENHFKALQAKMPDYTYLSLKLAYIHFLQGKKNAVQEVKKILKSSTNPDELHFGAVILRKSGDKKTPVTTHEKLYKTYENDPVYALYLAREYVENKRYPEALDLLNDTIKRHKDPLAIEMLSFVLLQKGANDLIQGNLSDAKKTFEQAQELNIHPTEAICNLSQILILENKRDDAWRLFQKAESQSADSPSVIKMSAQFDIFDKRYDSAIRRLNQLKDNSKSDLDGSGWYLMAIAQSHLGQWDEATKSLTEAKKHGISDSPATAVIVIQNALQAFENNDYTRAEKALSVAAKYKDQMNPADKVRYDYLTAISHLRNRKFSQAKSSLESTKNGFNKLSDSEKKQVIETGSLNLSFELAYVQYELNNFDAAISLLSGINTTESKSLEAAIRRKLAFTALKNRKYDQAQEHYNKLTTLSSANTTDQYNLFITQLLTNKASNPADKLEKFVKQNMPESLLNYAIYLDNAGNNDEAMKYYRKYVEQNSGSHIEEVRQMLTSKARVWGP